MRVWKSEDQCPHHPRAGARLARRQKGQPPEVIAISWRAQTRLNARYRRLLARSKEKNRIVTAIARELVGFIWETLQVVPTTTADALAAWAAERGGSNTEGRALGAPMR